MSEVDPAELFARPRLYREYKDEVVPALKEEFKYANPMQIPSIEKVVVTMALGEAARD